MTTEWNDFLARQGYRGDGAGFGDPAGELAAARDATVLMPLTDVGLIRASGEDAAGFLHNLLTNDVKGITADGARLAGLCNAKGRLMATLLIWRSGDDYLLLLSADLLATVLKKLSMYILRSKVKLADASAERLLFGIAGPDAAAAIAAELGGHEPGEAMSTAAFAGGQAIALGGARHVLALDPAAAPAAWQKLARHARPAGLAAWHWLDIRAGLPRVVAATTEAFIPQMLNFEAVGGVSFTKGCYPGQEVVARTQYLGKIKRRMYRGRLAAPAAAATPVYAPETGDQSCGALVEVAPSPDGGYECLAVVQSTCAEAGEIRVGNLAGERLGLLPLPYPVG